MRNALLMIATVGLLSVGYFYYAGATQIQRVGVNNDDPGLNLIADESGKNDREPMVVDLRNNQSVPVAPGQETGFTVYDEFTGRAIQKFHWTNWEKVPGTRNDVAVTAPELQLFTQQLIVTIRAANGQLAVDEVDRRSLRPRKGWLEGDVVITVDRDPEGEETRAAVALDGIKIHLEKMHFDVELGELKADGKLRIEGPAFSLFGTGLRLVWNDVDRRVDTLEILQGEKLSLAMQSGLLSQVRSGPEGAPTSQPTEEDQRGRVMTYAVALLGDVEAETFRGEQPTGKLTASELHLLFDMAGKPKQAFENQGAATPEQEGAAEAPQVAATDAPRGPIAPPEENEASDVPEKLELRWSGPLRLAPQLSNYRGGPLRRHIEARGDLVRLTGNGSTIECGGLLYREEQRRLWLHPRDERAVTLRMDAGPAVDATSIFFDRDAAIVKLVGDVRVRDLAGGLSRDRLGVRSKLWAELHLAEEDTEEPLPSSASLPKLSLKRAVFAGGVQASLNGGRSLHAQRLETRFIEVERPEFAGPPAPKPETAAQRPAGLQDLGGNLQMNEAIASGSVRLRDGEQSLHGTWMKIAFESGPDGRTYPADLSARGEVGLKNPDQGVYARGRRLTATLTRDGQLTDAAIIGEKQHPAVALAQTYRVMGERINVGLEPRVGSQQPFHIRVPGQAELVFTSDRGLQGRAGTGAPIRITAQKALEFDSDPQRNEIRFVGNVVAQEGNQRLDAEVLTLFLKDIQETKAPLKGIAAVREAWTAGWAAYTGATKSSRDLGSSIRKEPLRLRAQHAQLTSETYVPERTQPVVMQMISAPELTVEIPQRTVRTVGETVLGMTSLKMPAATPAPSGNTGGLHSAMMSRGPSQTALMCSGSMTYVFGEQDTNSGDSVLFEGGVFFRHVAGPKIKNFASLLPEVANNPTQVAQLKDRNTKLTCDRLELLLSQAGSNLPGQGLTLGWLNARGDVRLTDQQGAGIRTVNANQIEFDRNAKTVRVLGDQGQPARVEYMNRETNRFEQPAVGPAFTIYLDSNTVKAERVSGSIQR